MFLFIPVLFSVHSSPLTVLCSSFFSFFCFSSLCSGSFSPRFSPSLSALMQIGRATQVCMIACVRLCVLMVAPTHKSPCLFCLFVCVLVLVRLVNCCSPSRRVLLHHCCLLFFFYDRRLFCFFPFFFSSCAWFLLLLFFTSVFTWWTQRVVSPVSDSSVSRPHGACHPFVLSFFFFPRQVVTVRSPMKILKRCERYISSRSFISICVSSSFRPYRTSERKREEVKG